MIQIYLFLTFVVIAFVALFFSLQFKNVFLGVFAGIMFLLLCLPLYIGDIQLTDQSQDMKYVLNSWDYQLYPHDTTETKEYFILSPSINPVIDLGENFEITTHIFTEDGEQVNATDLVCNLHLYKMNGHHAVTANMIYEPSYGYDYELEIGGGNFSTPGKYEYRIYCNNNKREGGASSYLIVKEDSSYQNITLGSLFVLLALFIIWQAEEFVRGKKKEKEDNNHEEDY